MTHSHLFTSRAGKALAAVAVGAAAIASALFSPVAANAADGTYYPSGPQTNVALSTVTDGGWVLCWSESYASAGTSLASIWNGTASGSVSACDGSKLLLTGWANSNPNILPVLAAAGSDEVKTETAPNAPHLANGTFWYLTPGQSVGFSPNPQIVQNSCDSGDQPWNPNGGNQDQRLCWHFTFEGNDTTLETGFSLGNLQYLNAGDPRGGLNASDFTRAVFKQAPPLHKGSVTNAGTLARALKLTSPAGGSLSLSVSDASSGACRVVNNKVYAFHSGACVVTVTSLKANGDAKAAKTRTYLVG